MSLADYACADESAHVFVYHADALSFLRTLPDNWTHCIITDPPYGYSQHRAGIVAETLTAWASGDRERVPDGKGFMGREWDAFVPPPAVWDECLRVLKPGGHLAVFAGPRTVDLMGLSIRLAGFEMRDTIGAWLYGSGFPKSRRVAADLDRMLGKKRERVALVGGIGAGMGEGRYVGDQKHSPTAPLAGTVASDEPITDAAREWQGWGTALKPAHEPILLARKPLSGTVAANVLAHRTGAINVDACRVATDEPIAAHHGTQNPRTAMGDGWHDGYQSGDAGKVTQSAGRWPSNVVLAHHPECGPDEAPGPCVSGCQVAALDEQSGTTTSKASAGRQTAKRGTNALGDFAGNLDQVAGHDDSGGASRFFPTFRYQAKAPKTERPIVDGTGHPTVKPLGLMRWLVRLLVPGDTGEGAGCVLDPFAGSGATLEAARLENRRAVGIERDDHSVSLIAERLGVSRKDAA